MTKVTQNTIDRLRRMVHLKLGEIDALFPQFGVPQLSASQLLICDAEGNTIYVCKRQAHGQNQWTLEQVGGGRGLSPSKS